MVSPTQHITNPPKNVCTGISPPAAVWRMLAAFIAFLDYSTKYYTPVCTYVEKQITKQITIRTYGYEIHRGRGTRQVKQEGQRSAR